jgi:hypothetical protein
MKTKNHNLQKSAKTFEFRMLDAVSKKDADLIGKIMNEAEMLYEEEYLTQAEYNFFINIDGLKELI